MSNHFWWYLSRASGTVAWVLVLVTCAWGILLATRLFRGWDRPAWLLDLHRWLGSLLLASTVLHVFSLIGDNYTHFTMKSIFIPFASEWHPRAVALGVLSMYMIVAVQITSWAMKKLPKRVWRGIHMLSYVAFVMVTWHAMTAGTDASSRWYGALTVAMVALACAFGTARLITLKSSAPRQLISNKRNSTSETKKEESPSVLA